MPVVSILVSSVELKSEAKKLLNKMEEFENTQVDMDYRNDLYGYKNLNAAHYKALQGRSVIISDNVAIADAIYEVVEMLEEVDG